VPAATKSLSDRNPDRFLTPEEDAIGEPDGDDDDIDDTLPADLWFRSVRACRHRSPATFTVYSPAG
jgi:hypothetical protein